MIFQKKWQHCQINFGQLVPKRKRCYVLSSETYLKMKAILHKVDRFQDILIFYFLLSKCFWRLAYDHISYFVSLVYGIPIEVSLKFWQLSIQNILFSKISYNLDTFTLFYFLVKLQMSYLNILSFSIFYMFQGTKKSLQREVKKS